MSGDAWIFLLLGHVVGDFVLQSRELADRKRHDSGAVLRHAGLVYVAHAAALLPLWLLGEHHGAPLYPHAYPAVLTTWALTLTGLTLAHAAIDFGKAAYERRRGPSLGSFFVDQAAHVACLLLAAWVVSMPAGPLVAPPDCKRAAIVITAYLLATFAGSAVVRLVLARHPLQEPSPTERPQSSPPHLEPPQPEPPQPNQSEPARQGTRDGARPDAGDLPDRPDSARMGHTIGVLERALGLSMVLLDAWAGLAGILAAKSIARFKDLEQRAFGEYFLVGTLTSLLVTVLVGAGTVRCLEHVLPQ